MGLFGDIGNFAKKNIGAIAGTALGGPLGGFLGKSLQGKMSGNDDAANAEIAQHKAEMDKYQRMVDDARDKYQGEAQNYRRQLPGLQQSMANQAAGTGRQDLARDLAKGSQGMSKRGLLYSGLQQGEQAGARGKFYTDQSQKRAQINEQTEAQARQLEDQAMQAGLQAQAARIGNTNQAYNTALAQKLGAQQGQQGLFGSILGAGGKLFGEKGLI